MPGDLRDPEQMQPWHHDNMYDATPNQFEQSSPSMDEYLQTIAVDAVGKRMDPETLDRVKRELDEKGFFFRNPGDESFRKEVFQLTRRMAATNTMSIAIGAALDKKINQRCLAPKDANKKWQRTQPQAPTRT